MLHQPLDVLLGPWAQQLPDQLAPALAPLELLSLGVAGPNDVTRESSQLRRVETYDGEEVLIEYFVPRGCSP